MNVINVALVQQRMQADYRANLDYGLAEIDAAAENGADLVVLCELHTSLYFCQEKATRHFELAQSIPGALTRSLGRSAKRNRVVIVGCVFEKRGQEVFHDSAVVLDKDGDLAGVYRKMHIPDDPGYYERYYFAPGDSGFHPIHTSIGRLGVMICWDQWFPEAARLMALAGAQILIYPSAIGWDADADNDERQREVQAWLTIQQSHAIANNLPLVCVNRVGHEPSTNGGGIRFWGHSFVCNAGGKITSRASSEHAQTLYAAIDLSETERIRRTWPYFRDRRTDAYGDIIKRLPEND